MRLPNLLAYVTTFVDLVLHIVLLVYYRRCTFASPLLTILDQKRAHLKLKARKEGEITNPHDKKRHQYSSLSLFLFVNRI
jgi:hypothetical protein